MARTKQTARKSVRPLVTWTRFCLRREQEWPTWVVDHLNIYIGPLVEVDGVHHISLGRMVDNPEQAAFILEWTNLEALKNFQSSPACAAFLQNLPESNPDTSRAPGIESGSALERLTLDDASPSSRFLTLKHKNPAVTTAVKGLVTLTTYMVPRTADEVLKTWREDFHRKLGSFVPDGYGFLKAGDLVWSHIISTWFLVLEEDGWVGEKFGRLERCGLEGDGHDSDHGRGRTLFCHFLLWSNLGASPEHEAAAAEDPRARESWDEAIAEVMPPATAWQQERWDIRKVPRCFPPNLEFESDSEERAYEEEQQRQVKEYVDLHFQPPQTSDSGRCLRS
ncbi:hypothetical protein C8A05DRAFT_46018 [Staphylotrichum tortipilum]|uniref:ABM domain-containing protein n=1 Tax=Staphylotrichum tortipilum TaxID=2831512 RepID=A0AAN6MHK5_9PEZI|nr:hypothetical protein C8A05DRAFT_46018 [Staphylotrichum longicolle]